MPQGHPYQAYRNTDVQTAGQGRLILMLYDGAIRFLKKGRGKIYVGDPEGAHNYLVRGRDIVSELLATLKPEKAGQIGDNLMRLYTYAHNRLVEANLMKDAAAVDEVIQILSVLREGWAGAQNVEQARPENRGLQRRVDVKM